MPRATDGKKTKSSSPLLEEHGIPLQLFYGEHARAARAAGISSYNQVQEQTDPIQQRDGRPCRYFI